jgi:hypothetical protein
MVTRSETLGFDRIAGLAERRANRRSLGVVEAFSVLKGADNWRYHITIKTAVEHSEIWFISSPEGSLIEFKNQGRWVLPFWPHEDVARLACKQMNIVGVIDPMPLDHWIDCVLDECCRSDDSLVALCPSNWHAELKTVDDVFADLKYYRTNSDAYWEQYFSKDRFVLTPNVKAGPKGKLP